jgi:hypothetical protein
MAALSLPMTRLMVALSMTWLMLLCPMNQVMAALSKPLLMLLCPIPSHGCFVRDLGFATLSMAWLIAAWSMI